MKLEKFEIAFILVLAAVVLISFAEQKEQDETCKAKGGVRVKTSMGYDCIKGEVIE